MLRKRNGTNKRTQSSSRVVCRLQITATRLW